MRCAHCLFIVLAFVSGWFSSVAHAQCDNGWEPGPLDLPLLGANGPIYAIWSWSLPGQSPQLIVGGDFTRIGGIDANNIAAWDGQFWRSLGSGRPKPVYALTTYNLSLIAGGEGSIAAWAGSGWTNLATPLPTNAVGDYPSCYALAIFNGNLYAGGDFEYLNSIPIPPSATGNLWVYNGSNWFRVPAGVGSSVNALQVFDQDGGAGPIPAALYVGGSGGSTVSLRKWDGTTATSIDGPYVNTLQEAGSVRCMTVVNSIGAMPGGLIVGGGFLYAPNPSGGNMQVRHVARFDGTNWHQIAGGVSTSGGGIFGSVGAVRAFGSHLFVGGTFAEAGTGGNVALANNIARFNGSVWSSVGSGTNGSVSELREFNGSLIASGSFTQAGGGSAARIARWSGTQWFNYSEPFSINALARIGSRIVAGGSFSRTTTAGFPPVTTQRTNILTWDTENQGGLGWGTDGAVRAMVSYSTGSGPTAANHVVAGGDFTSCGPDQFGFGINANRVARWSEPALTAAGWEAMGQGFNGSVYALDRFVGETIAGGAFTLSGATGLSRLARWTGSPASWQPLTTPDPALNGTVRALKVFQTTFSSPDTYLCIGGDFTSAPGVGISANRIIQRKHNPVVGLSEWQALGSGFNGTVYAIERLGSGTAGRTIAAGSFTMSGGVTVNRIARYNNGAWEPLGNGGAGGGFNDTVYALRNVGGILYAAGAFTSVDGIPANRLAKWNGTAWSDASGGADNHIFALMGYNTELIAGGVFEDVENDSIESAGLGRVKATGVPWILTHPLSKTRECLNEPVFFDVVLPEGYETATYQWRKDGVPMTDGPTGTGSQAFNTQTQSLYMYYLGDADEGVYDCVVTNVCGSVTSTGATLTVEPCCYADINDDDMVNVTDLLVVISNWGPCPNCPNAPCFGDVTPAPASPAGGDCQVNVADLLAVIGEWGACP